MKKSSDVQHEKTVQEFVAEAKEKQALQAERQKSGTLMKRILELEKELEVIQALKGTKSHYKIVPAKDGGTEAVAVMVASDWHIEEMVFSHQVSGLNEFNESVCGERIARFFAHGLKLIKKEQKATKINTLVLALLGDFISNSIHEELLEGNRLSPTFAIIEAQGHIVSGIRYLLAHSKLKIVIPCASGNHGRFTVKTRISTEAGNSLERLMYHSLKQQFANEPRVEFIVSDGYHTYVKVFDTTLLFHHGHSVKYGGGVGGITIPLNKSIAQWNKGRKADIDICG